MANISKFLSLVSGIQRTVDTSVNTLLVQAIQINGVLLSSSASGNAGSKLVGDDNSYSNIAPSAATVKGALSAIDAAIGSISAASALDGSFRIKNTADNTKLLAFDASGIATGTTRTITMPNASVDLGNLTNSNISAAAAIAYSKLNLATSIVNADISAAAAIALSKLAVLGTNLALQSNASGVISVSSVTSTELGYLSGVTSAIQTQLNAKLNLSGGTMTGALNMGSNSVQSSYVPVSGNDLTNKTYVDNAIGGLSWKTAARVASTANVTVSSAPSAIDGITLASGNRILLKNQTTASENGIYTFSAAASPLVRATDMDTWTEVIGSVMLIIEGTVNAGSKWVNTNVDGGTIGSTSVSFTAFSITGSVNGSGTVNQVAYFSGSSTLTSEAFLAASRGGLGADASAFTGVLKFASGVASASSIVNADVSASAAIAYSKLALSASIVNADIATAAAIAYSKLALSASIVNADISASAAIAYSKLNLSNSIVAGDLTASSVTSAKVATGVFDQVTILGGAGTVAAVASAPSLKEILVAGESFAATTLLAVRFAKAADAGFVAGRVYHADYDTTSADNFFAIGLAYPASLVTASGNLTVTKAGMITATAHGFTVGAPLYLSAAGAITATVPSVALQAVVRVGIVRDANTIEVQIQVMAVN